MIPSTLAAEVGGALQDFLATGSGPSNPALSSVVDDFLAETENLLKGPYLFVELPFQRAPEGGEPFPETPLGFIPYRHQRTAFDRLAGGQSSVIATGTGSGKTECFLYPVLDHCRERSGTPGVKAIFIYPMNALASDQARRIAGIVNRTQSLRGKVTAGLYVGETGASPRTHMTADHLIENRDVLRERPPDILLTNYKMLDLLLTRPVDFPLWRHNTSGMLRYLVVDELHTFDGAQGTDLACLVRRLRARLEAGDGLVCVGTSATIGDAGDQPAILDYVSSVFHQRFSSDAVVGELRQGIDEFLEDTIISSYLVAQPGLGEQMDPARYMSSEDYIRAQHEVFFGEPPARELESVDWRLTLGRKLREHASFVNLLRVLDGSRPTPVGVVLSRLQRSLPVSGIHEAELCLRSLCALISVARQREGTGPDVPVRPLLNVKLHVWVRELRRMVCSLYEEREDSAAPTADAPPSGNGVDHGAGQGGSSDSAHERPAETVTAALSRTDTGDEPPEGRDVRANGPTHRIRYADDLKPDEDSIHLPLIQCRECHATGWGCVKHAAEHRVGQDLRVFYNRFFLRDVDVSYLFPLAPDETPPPNVRGHESKVCGRCGYLLAARDGDACPGCGHARPTRVFRPDSIVSRRRGKGMRRELSRDCPYCGAREALIILGARASSLLSTGLAQLFASHHNDDHKVITFSDNVQDAAHRGSFFAARTWRNGIRSAISQVVANHEDIALGDLPDRVIEWWGRPDVNPSAFDEERFISEFIAPDRLWLRDFEALRKNGTLPAGSNLLSLVERRVRWDTLGELTFGAAIGRTLERTRAAAVGVDRGAFEHASGKALLRIREEFGDLRGMDELSARSLLLGILRRMKDRGAVASPMFGGYLRNGGNPHAFRDFVLQDFGPRSSLPVFPAPVTERDGVEALFVSPRSWYETWAEKVLTPIHVLAARRDTADVLLVVMNALCEEGLVTQLPARNTKVWALDPARLHVTTDTAVMRCANSSRTLVVPAREADLWHGVPCLDLAAEDRYVKHDPGRPTWAGRLYGQAEIRRIVSAEHTALVSRPDRDHLQERFAASDVKPWEPNLLSATPTLELGVDIGDLSTVVMCSVPPAPVSYVQRTGRAGRRDGNALTLTVAAGRPHDLYYYAAPMEMLGRGVEPPGIFLNAPAVLERQLTAFCLDCWVAGGVDENAIPRAIRTVLNDVDRRNVQGFPYPFFEYVAENNDDLLARFFSAFDPRSDANDGLDEASREFLHKFLHGADREESLRVRILKRLEEVAKDRQSMRNDADTLGRRIRTLQQGPPDDETKVRIKNLTVERRALQGLVKTINERETFGFLTDEGLLPNYAFPEQGVTLKSVIFRRRQAEESESESEESDTIVYDYLRPAAAALGELAPQNEFYAGGRRVLIRRIDTRVSPIETWRLCPSCAYCENIEAGDHHSTCPRCGDPLWGDAGQCRDMLRLRLVHAATQDRHSRIMDERDDREPLFFTRRLVADFDPESVSRAFATPDAEHPFGFEYVRSATFREMNFGRLDDQESPTAYAGEFMPRKGFSLCRRCGGVQDDKGEIQHTRTCNASGNQSIADCLYLYREFKSEAVRMLIPAAGSMNAEERASSFIAALELGLRRQFAGAVDHLRVTTCKFPTAESGVRLEFLMLYDTVPGGTGYLKQMMNDPDNVLRVFRMARDALVRCECNADPLKDGCYRCVYAYRRSHDMASTSRNTALAVLNVMLDQAEGLRQVEGGLHSVKVNPVLESELEARFIEALRRFDVDATPVRVQEEIVGGKPGYVLTTGGLTYYVEAQADIDESDGVAVASRPDFVIRPARTLPDQPPIAVFMDGFEYHRQRTGEDSAKRWALVRAGYLVWSLTWHDLEAVLGPGSDALDVLGGDDGRMAQLQRTLDTRWETGSLRDRLSDPSLELLVRYLQKPDAGAWKRVVFTRLLGLFEPGNMTTADLEREFADAVAGTLPPMLRDAFGTLPDATARAGRGSWRNTASARTQVFVAIPLAAVEPPDPDSMMVALHLDDTAPPENQEYRREWNGALRLYNLLQFLPSAWWTTTSGVERDLYPELPIPDPEVETPGHAEWAEAMSLADAGLHSTMEALAAKGIPPPDVGLELAGPEGEVAAEAELAWEAARGAVLLSPEAHQPFAEAGWRTFAADATDLTEAILNWWMESHP